MARTIYVVSDLHLGGSPGSDGEADLQMCGPRGRELLAAFFAWVGRRAAPHTTELVLAGDIVDFLAEAPSSAFCDDATADRKLAAVMERTSPIWDALAAAMASGVELTLLLGNHDLELSLPSPRRRLRARLGRPFEFLYDNEAFTRGELLVEHGNRYDPWNVVDHDGLRQLRSATSRREAPPGSFEAPVGSTLVVTVMNPIKKQFPFVDLLKPENAGVLPLLAFLDPSVMTQADHVLKFWLQKRRNRLGPSGRPVDPRQIAGESDSGVTRAEAARRLLFEAGTGMDPRQAGGSVPRLPFRERWRSDTKSLDLDLLRRVIGFFQGKSPLSAPHVDTRDVFGTDYEVDDYLLPATARMRSGFRAVVMGHTHLARRVKTGDGIYLNTGTWADLIRFPEGVLDRELSAEKRALWTHFADQLARGQLDEWREQICTYAEIQLDEGGVARDGDLFRFGADDKIERVCGSVMPREPR